VDSPFTPEAPSFERDPWSAYRELRDRPRAAWSSIDDAWMFTRYEDVKRLLHDHETFPSDDRPRPAEAATPEDSRSLHHLAILGLGPPQHTRLRRVIGRCFGALQVSALEPVIEKIVDGLLDEGLADGRIDLMKGLAIPLPLLVTAHMLGMDAGERRRLQIWANNEMTAIAPSMPEEAVRRLLRSSEEMLAYFRTRVADARKEGAAPGTVFGQLLLAAEEGGSLGHEELLAFLALLVKAGSHTVTHLIGNCVLALLRSRAHLEALREDPSLWPAALDELARHSGPMHSVLRVVHRPVEMHGIALEPGMRVHAVLASATSGSTKSPTRSASTAARRTTSRSGAASTTAWARRSGSSRRGSR
jgi:cytochrome P450